MTLSDRRPHWSMQLLPVLQPYRLQLQHGFEHEEPDPLPLFVTGVPEIQCPLHGLRLGVQTMPLNQQVRRAVAVFRVHGSEASFAVVRVITCRLRCRLGHVGAALRLAIVAVPRAVINLGGGVHPNLAGSAASRWCRSSRLRARHWCCRLGWGGSDTHVSATGPLDRLSSTH